MNQEQAATVMKSKNYVREEVLCEFKNKIIDIVKLKVSTINLRKSLKK